MALLKHVKLEYHGKSITAEALPALPSVLNEVLELIAQQNASTHKIAAVIAKDQALSAKVLKIINAPAYGFAGRITTIHNALALLGFNTLQNIIISSVVGDTMQRSVRDLWAHSYACSLACGSISKMLNLPNTAEFVVTGLLHDFGKAIVGIHFPDAHCEIETLVREEDITFYAAEKRVLGFTHLEVNDWIATQWSLPSGIRNAMIHHHAPVEDSLPLTCVTHLGDFFARLFEQGSGGDANVSCIDFAVTRQLNITMDTLEDILDSLGALFASDAGKI